MNQAVSVDLDQGHIQQYFQQARQAKQRHRDIAQHLQITEAQLLAAFVEANLPTGLHQQMQVTRLKPEFAALIEQVHTLGEVMALTRNPSCVHEKVGTYHKASHQGQMGLVLDAEIDLRVFYRNWAFAFAVQEQTADKDGRVQTQSSLQFFDAAGEAVHKIFLRPDSDVAAYQDLVQAFAADAELSQAALALTPRSSPPMAQPDAEINVAGLRTAWAAMADTHEFFGLLKKFAVTRTQALRLMQGDFTVPVACTAIEQVLTQAAAQQVPIMVFVDNHGMIQIHTGEVQKIVQYGAWLNVMDARFNLHLRTDHIAQAWVVRKPTADGDVTSLELFDAQGETIAMLFGARKPKQHERSDWRDLIAQVLQVAERG